MELAQQVCSLKFAKRLKELGATQESIFYWVERAGSWKLVWIDAENGPSQAEIEHNTAYAAFTVAELGHLLPPGTISYFQAYKDWHCKAPNVPKVIDEEWSEADARARMLIYLLEHPELIKEMKTEIPESELREMLARTLSDEDDPSKDAPVR